MKSQATIDIQRSPDQVFPYVDDADKLKLWMQDFISSTRPARSDVGSKFKMIFRQTGNTTRETESELLAYQPNKKITYKTVDQSFEVVIDFTLDGRDKTTLTQTIEGTPRSLLFKIVLSVLGRLMAGASAKQLQRDLNKLKEVVEGK